MAAHIRLTLAKSVFYGRFRGQIFQGQNKNPTSRTNRRRRAGAAAPARAMTLDMDADVAEWLKAQATDWQRNRHALSHGDKSIREAEYDEASPTGAACGIDSHYIPF